MEFEVGEKISIGKDKFDILKCEGEIDKYDSKKGKFIGEHIAVKLHKLGNSLLHPTHLLKVYPSGKMKLYKIVQEKRVTPTEILLKQRGGFFRYIDEKEISIEDIKKLNF